ncbi:hypothetical protein GCM10025762_34670 [Haloechinothrix salitolerans]
MNAAPRPAGHHSRSGRDGDDIVVVRQWTGREADALRCAVRMSVRGFADYLGISARAVSRWAQLGAETVPRPDMQAILDTALVNADLATRRRFAALTERPYHGRPYRFSNR